MNENRESINDSSEEQPDRLVDLLIERAIFGLGESEQQELKQLAPSLDDQLEFDRFEATAAAFDLSITSVDFEAMPSGVHDRLLISAGKMLGGSGSSATQTADRFIPATAPIDSHSSNEPQVELPSRLRSPSSVRWREVALIAVTAASLLLMLSGFNPFSNSDPAPVASAAEQMDRFIASQPSDLVDIVWKPVHAPNANGKVLWSDSKQEGYMVFSGLDANDPAIEQYQLWIFDTDTGQATPTDGGVFNISKAEIGADGQAIIPIKASVPVDRAVQFAVTVEKPGGVYVSKRKQIPVLATVED